MGNLTTKGNKIGGVDLPAIFNGSLINLTDNVMFCEFIQFLADPYLYSMFFLPLVKQDLYSLCLQLNSSFSRDIDGM